MQSFQVCARLAAEDLFSYSQIAHSAILKKGLRAQGYKPFDTHISVSRAVKRFALKVKAEIIATLKEKVEKGQRFSVTLDEFTAKNIHRYTDFNIHFPREEPRCIGMMRIHGSFDAETAAEKVQEKLAEFGLDIKCHVIANTTDGAAVMVSMGEMLPTLHQICHAHGLHLAVVAVLYKVRIDRAKYILLCLQN